MTDEFQLKGRENRRKRALNIWRKMWRMYSDPINPLPVEEIARRIKKKNGKFYSRGYIYQAFRNLRSLGEI